MKSKLSIFHITIFFISISGGSLIAQNRSVEDISTIKLMLILEALHTSEMTISEASEYLSGAELNLDTLESLGFPYLTFITISNPITSKIQTKNPPLFGGNCDHYVIAIHSKGDLGYRIKGFYNNDTEMLFLDANRNVIPKRKFLRNHRIEGLDLKCLYNAWEANSFDTEKYPCLKYCLEPISFH